MQHLENSLIIIATAVFIILSVLCVIEIVLHLANKIKNKKSK